MPGTTFIISHVSRVACFGYCDLKTCGTTSNFRIRVSDSAQKEIGIEEIEEVEKVI